MSRGAGEHAAPDFAGWAGQGHNTGYLCSLHSCLQWQGFDGFLLCACSGGGSKGACQGGVRACPTAAEHTAEVGAWYFASSFVCAASVGLALCIDA